jgi:large subunit ribosomal protein L1
MSKQKLDELIEESEAALEKGEDLSEIDAEHHGDKSKSTPKGKTQKSKVEEEIKEKKFGKKEGKEEVEDVKDVEDKEGEKGRDGEKEIGEKEEKKDEKKSNGKVKAKAGKAKIRSKKYQEVKNLIDVKKKYEIEEAIDLVKKTSMTKFDGNVELHIRILGKTKKPEQIRGLINYPHATGKKNVVVILDEKTIDEIATTGKVIADIYLASPVLMPKIGKIAKILGPKGKMPNPKSGTVTDKPEVAKAEIEGGKSEYKTDSYGIIHQVIGKVSAKPEELTENFKAIMTLLPAEKISSINLCATMGPAVKIKI